MILWEPRDLVNAGVELNRTLVDDLLVFAGTRDVDRPLAAAFSMLTIANAVSRTDARDEFLDLINARVGLRSPEAIRAAIKPLRIRRWSPVQRCLMAFASAPSASPRPNPEELIAIQAACHKAMAPSWATLMPDKMYVLARMREKGSEFNSAYAAKLLPPFGKAVQLAFGAYAGVEIEGQPSRIHHTYLQNFQRAWSNTWGGNVLDLNSGLHRFGEENLRG